MVLSVLAEVEYNRAMLDRYVPIHRTWRDALDSHDPATGRGSAVDVLFDTRPVLLADMNTNVPVLRRAAWDTALSTGALRLVDYDVAAGISEIYSMQEYASSLFPTLFDDASFFDPAMRELTFAEESLFALYDKHLPVLREASSE